MRRVALFAVVTLCAAEARAEPPKTLYELSSPDVGQPWHLHAKDGALVCELPCEAWVGARSGDYLVVHDDPKKVWRVDLPSTPDGDHVSMTARIGKGSPALGAFGEVLAIGGAAAGVSGVALLVASLFSLSCSSTSPCDTTNAVTYATVAVPLIVAGGILASIGIYLTDHNRSASGHVVVTPMSIAGTF
ncbi:MAG TPA: hypothetical protein VH054_21035 [Polyangiaceae bacterium]|jgi:hypothetical protein|nr:hypothetical protein [Polyangiaceae bacterium]